MPYDSQDPYTEADRRPHIGGRYYGNRNFSYGAMPDVEDIGDRASKLFVYVPQQINCSLAGLLGAGTPVAWARVQSFNNNSKFAIGPQTAFTQALGSPVAIGDTIAIVSTEGGDVTTLNPTITDQLGNTYTRVTAGQGGRLFDTPNSQGTDAWWCIVTVAGTPTLTYTPGSTASGWIALKGDHFTGSAAGSVLRDSKGAKQVNPGAGANAIATASIAAQNGDLLWVGNGYAGTAVGAAEVAGTGFTAPTTVDATSTLITEWETAAGAGAATLTDATNGGANTYMTIALAISPAIGGPPLSGALTTTYIPGVTSVSLGGALTFVGALVKQTSRSLAGGFTPGGVLQKLTARILSGGFTPAGALTKLTSRVLAGGFTPAGALLHVIAKALSGGFTPSGITTKQTNRTLAGGSTPSGALSKKTSRSLAGGFTPSGALTKLVNRILAGGFTPSGTLSTFKVRLIALAGGFTPSGTLSKLTSRVLTGGFTPAGALLKKTSKTLAGSIAPSGALSRFLSKVLSGGFTPSGTLATFKVRLITLAGAFVPSGTVQKQTARAMQGAIVPSGAVSRRTFKTFAAQIGLSGQLSKFMQKTFGGLLVPQGVLTWAAIGHDFLILLAGTQGARYILGALAAVRYRLESKSQSRYGPTYTGEASDDPINTSSSKDDL